MVVAPLIQDAQANLDKIFLEDFRVAFKVGRFPSILRLVLNCFGTSHSIGWILLVEKWI
jgi:hypothetical protein